VSDAEWRPDVRDLVWTDFDPTLGREQAGRRPAVVLSSATLFANTGFVIVCPITSRVRPFPTSVVLPPGLPISGEILIANLRSLDALARPLRPVGAKVPEETARLIRAKLDALIVI
jgi:mRNA interferase MazF